MTPAAERTEHNDEHAWSIVATRAEDAVQVEVKAYRIIAWEEPAPGESVRLYERADGDVAHHVRDLEQSAPTIRATVKWDACMHYWIGDANGYMHLCGPDDVDSLTWALARIRDLAAELLGDQWQP